MKMMRESRRFATTKQRVAFTANLRSLSHHKVLRHFVGTEYQGEDLDGGFEFLRHHIVRAELMQLIQLAQIAGTHNHMELGIQSLGNLHDPPSNKRIRYG